MASPFLAGFPGGLMEGQQFAQQQELRRLQLQQALQEQQTLGAIGRTLRQNPQLQLGGFPGSLSGGPSQPTGFQAGVGQDIATALTGGLPQGGGTGSVTPLGGGLASALPPPSGAVRGSWFGNAPGWVDPSDSGLQASGVPVSAGPGIALPSRATLGQQFDVTAPSGQTMTLPQTDIGPAKWTGRGVDINAPAAAAMGYTPKTFPTDQQFIVKAHNQLDGTLGQSGGKLIQAGMPVPAVQASTQTARAAGRLIDPQQWGRSQLPDIFSAVDQANPKAPDAVKVLAALQLNKVAAPEERMALQMWAKENSQAIQLGLAQFRAATAEQRLLEGQGNLAGIYQSGGQTFGVTRSGQVKQLGLPGDVTKPGTTQPEGAALDPQTLSTMADQYLAGDRTVMQNLGRGVQGSKNIVSLRGEIARKMAESGMSGQDMATKLAEFEGLKAGERTLTQRTANIGMRIAEAKTFAPLALSASDKVDRTQYPTLNSLLLAAEKGTGNEDVIRLSVATQSLLNAYAAAVTPTGTPTEGAQTRAHELLDKAWSQGQFRVAIDQLMKEMDAASKSPGIVREEFRRGAAAPAAGGQPVTGPTSGGISAPAPSGGVPTVTKEQYDALPSGSPYMIPGDPNQYKKP